MNWEQARTAEKTAMAIIGSGRLDRAWKSRRVPKAARVSNDGHMM